MKEKKHRVEDALQATRAALEEGIVPGGGVALRQRGRLDQARLDQDPRRADRRCDHRPRARGAAPPAGATTPASRARSSSTQVRAASEGQRSERRDRRGRGSRHGRDHRSDHGHALGAAERRVDREEHPHHRGDRRRAAREERRSAPGRHARHGRDDVTGMGKPGFPMSPRWVAQQKGRLCRPFAYQRGRRSRPLSVKTLKRRNAQKGRLARGDGEVGRSVYRRPDIPPSPIQVDHKTRLCRVRYKKGRLPALCCASTRGHTWETGFPVIARREIVRRCSGRYRRRAGRDRRSRS